MHPNSDLSENQNKIQSKTDNFSDSSISNPVTMPESTVIQPSQPISPVASDIIPNPVATGQQPTAAVEPNSSDIDTSPAAVPTDSMVTETNSASTVQPSVSPVEKPLGQSTAVSQNELGSEANSLSQTLPSTPIVVGSPFQAGDRSRSKLGKKRLLVSAGVVVVLIALAAGAVFGLYLPNTPANVWSNGLDRSGKAIHSLVTSATSKESLASFDASDISGTVTATLSGQKYQGDFTTKFDKSNLDGGFNVDLTQDGSADKKLSLKVLSTLGKDTVYPDIYFQVSGIKAFGLDQMVPQVAPYDGKWIYASSSYLKSISADLIKTNDNTQTQVTSSDVATALQAVTKTTQDYVFTSDTSKAVLVQKEFVGKETVDGVKAYHYKATINNAHAESYCTALSNASLSTELYKKLYGQSASEIAQAKKDAITNCKDSTKNLSQDTGVIDVWMDSAYKIIYKIRIYDHDDSKIYTDIGQHYKGGDDVAMFVNYHDPTNKIDGNLNFTTNMKSHSSSATLAINSTSDDPYSVKLTLNAKPMQAPVTVVKPTQITNIEDVIKALGISEPSSQSVSLPVSGSAADVKRQTDIQSIDLHLETYYAENGFYPTLTDINNASWRTANFKGADPSSFQDPAGNTSQLTTTATATQYGYKPDGCLSTGADCQSFTLSAMLSSGKLYTKQSF